MHVYVLASWRAKAILFITLISTGLFVLLSTNDSLQARVIVLSKISKTKDALLSLPPFEKKILSPGDDDNIPETDLSISTSHGLKKITNNVENLPENRTDIVHVMICSDQNTLVGMVTLINSIYTHSKSPVYFHLVVYPEDADHIHQWLSYYFEFFLDVYYEIIFFDASMVKDLILVRGHRQELGSPLNFARYFLPDLLPEFNGRLVYIDDDCLVLGDITEFRNTPLAPGMVGAFSADDRNSLQKFLNFENQKIKDLGLNPHDMAFNAGVFLVDMDMWRKYNISNVLLTWLKANLKDDLFGSGAGGGASQPPMLIALHNKVSFLPPEWHVRHLGWSLGQKYPKEVIKNAKLLHWNGANKPWKKATLWILPWYMHYLEDPTGKFAIPARLTKIIEEALSKKRNPDAENA